ncbi:MAG TPA: hypothetical protein VGL03_14125 [Thermoanaerobaculia bacterium]|jgi:hypothetical protein
MPGLDVVLFYGSLGLSLAAVILFLVLTRSERDADRAGKLRKPTVPR